LAGFRDIIKEIMKIFANAPLSKKYIREKNCEEELNDGCEPGCFPAV
jgi:hypothetical protein